MRRLGIRWVWLVGLWLLGVLGARAAAPPRLGLRNVGREYVLESNCARLIVPPQPGRAPLTLAQVSSPA